MGENETPSVAADSARPVKSAPVVPAESTDSAVPESTDVSVSLAGPFLVHSFVGELASGDKLTVNADGVRVSAADAEELVAQARLAGVELRIGE